MRIIAGSAKGTPLTCPKSGVRPTTDRIRGAVFSSLGDRVIDATVLDLFAGSGGIGLEAASRGAREVTLVEQSPAALAVIEKNVGAVARNPDVTCRIAVVPGDVFGEITQFKRKGEKFGIIFADPPYSELSQRLLHDADLPALLVTGGLLVLELAAREVVMVGSPWQLSREARYGDTRVQFLARE